jgi:predicted small secreted protein
MIRKIVFTLVAAATVASLTACNTVKGLGRDIQSIGKSGDDAIN